MNVSPARKAAYNVLLKIDREKAFSSVLLPHYEKNLSANDRGLCHQLVLGVLRNQIWLDHAISFLTGGKKLDVEILIILRLGIYQLQFLDKIPAYSALNESVELTKIAKKNSAKGFVNAILRKFTRTQIPAGDGGRHDRIALETSHPLWLIERWADQFGVDEAEAIAQENNSIPASVFRLTINGRDSGTAVSSDHSQGRLVPSAFIADKITPELADLADSGHVYFQDEGSQLVGRIVSEQPGNKILDVCAAPGSKTSQIALEKGNKGGSIVAGDLYDARVRFLRENCQNQGAKLVSIVQYDAEDSLPFAAESFDTVFVDAPCTGTGTIRHNPEIRYLLDPADIGALSSKQLAILLNASKHVKPGGKLIYSTCSLEYEENEGVVNSFVGRTNDFKRTTPVTAEDVITDDNFIRTFPHRHSVDGFFVAIFERIDGRNGLSA